MEKAQVKLSVFSNIASLIKKIRAWIKKNPKEFIAIIIIISIASLLRLYKISGYMTFLGDEGRDVIIVRRLLINFDLILVGPGTSIGNMYLGPLYYYLMAPALLIANFSPAGPAVQIALMGILTVFFVWYIARKWFGPIAGIVASFLYSIAPVVIIYSRSSWNPNIMPLFALLCIYSLWMIWQENKFMWFVVLGISYAFVLQSHYLGLLLSPTLLIFILLAYLKVRKSDNLKPFIRNGILGILLFSFLMSPLVIFDARHGWRNFSAMKTFFTVRQETVSIKPWRALPKIPIIAEKISIRLLAGANYKTGIITLIVLILMKIYLAFSLIKSPKKQNNAYFLISLWVVFAMVGLGLYKQEIYDHYFGFFFPAPFLLTGGIFQSMFAKTNGYWRIVVVVLILILIGANIIHNPLKNPPNMQLQRSMEVADKIIQESKGEEFNIAVIAERNYEDGYQYFLEKNNAKIVEIDAQRPETITNQLFVVCEMEREKCDPTHNPKAQVANFGWSQVENEWNVFGVPVFKLVHRL